MISVESAAEIATRTISAALPFVGSRAPYAPTPASLRFVGPEAAVKDLSRSAAFYDRS
ncbi:hypothetical protein [Phyllobacterium salinisoli]|uniref:hypothetical protein n=1 Tax=Phyllobacterium salinisoli TaxID=1899321 RepID=UPI001356B6E2|nr:hypothetical protein [Phyllobacterium salinisoli]